ncbi:MAG: DUF58 domain-containing protein [Ruminococcaceae bacterium]|nr:DUF58 domain-containing protein [Oscillospiraceae bacterium]
MSDILYWLSETALTLITSRLFWILFFITAISILLFFIYKKLKIWALERVEYLREFSSDGVFVGDTIELVETIKNRTWFPLFSVQVGFFLPSGLKINDLVCNDYTKVTSIFFIPPFSTVSKKHNVVPVKREHYKLNMASILYRKNEFVFNDDIDFFAYPDVFDTGINLSRDLCFSGNIISSKKYIEDRFFVSGVRPYYYGAPMNSINFKASTRSFSGGIRQLVCNSCDSSKNSDSMIFLNLTHYSEISISDEEQVELGLKYACFLFCESLKNAGCVGFATNCSRDFSKYVHIPSGSGVIHSKKILEAFSEIAWYAKRDYSMNAILKKLVPSLSADTDIFLITPMVDDELSRTVNMIKQAGYAIHIIPLEERSK